MRHCGFCDLIPKKKEIEPAVSGNIQSIYDCNKKIKWHGGRLWRDFCKRFFHAAIYGESIKSPQRKGGSKMKGIIAAAGVCAAVILYCCIRAGAQEDRWMEEMQRRGETDAGGGNG